MGRALAVIGIVALVLCGAAGSAFAKDRDVIEVYTDVDIPREMIVHDVVSIGGDVRVRGTVVNNMTVVWGSVTLEREASVGGHIIVIGGDLVRAEGARTGGKVTQIYLPHFVPSLVTFVKSGWVALWAVVSIFVLLGFIGLALLLAALLPQHMGAMVGALERSFGSMFLWGLLWSLLVFPVFFFLIISIIGIVLIPLEFLIVALALIVGYITAAVFIGTHVVAAFRKKPIPFVDAVIGLLILFLIGLVPFVGTIVKLAFLIAGFGAVLVTRFGTAK